MQPLRHADLMTQRMKMRSSWCSMNFYCVLMLWSLPKASKYCTKKYDLSMSSARARKTDFSLCIVMPQSYFFALNGLCSLWRWHCLMRTRRFRRRWCWDAFKRQEGGIFVSLKWLLVRSKGRLKRKINRQSLPPQRVQQLSTTPTVPI